MQEDVTVPGQPEGDSPDAGTTASQPSEETIGLSELNQLLGKQFGDKTSALKSIKDTNRYVGKVGQLEKELEALRGGNQAAAQPSHGDSEVASEVASLRKQVEESEFFSENPQYKEYRQQLREMRDMTGRPLADLVSSQAFKPFLEKAVAQDEQQRRKTVMESSPRLGAVKDDMRKAQEYLKANDVSAAEDAAVAAVLKSM